MYAVLYPLAAPPQELVDHQLNLYENTGFGYIGRQFQVAKLLGVMPTEVSVLAAGRDFIVFGVPLSTGGRNQAAEPIVGPLLPDMTLGGLDPDSHLIGPVLVLSSERLPA